MEVQKEQLMHRLWDVLEGNYSLVLIQRIVIIIAQEYKISFEARKLLT